jgi:hypothetical protein
MGKDGSFRGIMVGLGSKGIWEKDKKYKICVTSLQQIRRILNGLDARFIIKGAKMAVPLDWIIK